MKSAYELAMERLEKESGPTRKLTDDQRAAIADIDKKYEARIAETRLDFDAKISQAATPQDLHQLQADMTEAVRALEEKREAEKNAVWEAS